MSSATSFADMIDLARLRTSVEYYVGSESWALDVFYEAWSAYEQNSGGAK